MAALIQGIQKKKTVCLEVKGFWRTAKYGVIQKKKSNTKKVCFFYAKEK